jgi:penicillin-binding protein 1C
VTLFLADPLARLPSFPRYGATEYPFPVALKTGTSQGYRDAWVVAWSRRYMVGVWVGRGDAGTMLQLSGARTAARLARAVLLDLHGAVPGDLADTGFPPPTGRVPVELCVYGGKRSSGGCGQTLVEWVRPDEMPPVANAAVIRRGPEGARLVLAMPAAHRAWAKAEGYPVADDDATAASNAITASGATAASGSAAADDPAASDGPRLSIVAPEHNSRIWRNPETPAALDRLALKAVVEPRVPQVVWYVDGEPFAVADPDKPVYWPISPGAHRFQLRLPYRDGASRPVRIVVE